MLGGRYALHFAGWKKHIGLYPVPDARRAARERDRALPRREGLGRLPAQPQPLPYELIGRASRTAIVAQRGRRRAAVSRRALQHRARVAQHRLVDHAALVREDPALALGRGEHARAPTRRSSSGR